MSLQGAVVHGRGFSRNAKVAALAGIIAACAGGYASAADMPVKSPPPAAPAEAPFFIVNENSLTFGYDFTATDPGVNKTAKETLTYNHFDVWQYGTNFLAIEYLKSDQRDPAGPCNLTGARGCAGATEVYGLFRSTLGFNELSHSKSFSIGSGPGSLQNVSFEFGGDANTETGGIDPEKKDVVAGLQFTFALPWSGHLNVSPLAYKEWNHNAFITNPPDGNTNFRWTWAVENGYSLPLGFLPTWLPLGLNGFFNWYGPKGSGDFGQAPTATEFHSEQDLVLDVGKMAFNKSGYLLAYVGYRYWHNKFGINPSPVGFAQTSWTVESTWTTGLTIKF